MCALLASERNNFGLNEKVEPNRYGKSTLLVLFYCKLAEIGSSQKPSFLVFGRSSRLQREQRFRY